MDHRRLLIGAGPGIAKRRVAFAAEVQETLDAINRLQEIYDLQLKRPEAVTGERSIA